MKKTYYGLLCALMILFLFFYPARALSASRTGLSLWFDTLIPALLPFMILSGFLIRANLIRPISALFYPVLHPLLGLSHGGIYAIFMGFLCGYPMGAKVLSDLRGNDIISHEEASYLLGFCNNISPSFLITFFVTEQWKDPSLLLPTLAICYGAPLTWGLLQNPGYRKTMGHQFTRAPLASSACTVPLSFALIDDCILDGVLTIVRLGGYVLIFALLSAMIGILPLPDAVSAIATAICEITNGIPAILQIYPNSFGYLLLMVLIPFGGLSALAQTNSVIKSAHLSLWKYVRSKCIISIIALVYTLLYLN